MKVIKKVFSIFLMILIIPLFIAQLNVSAAIDDVDLTYSLELFWTDSDQVTQDGNYHLVTDEIDGNYMTIPAIATYSLTAVMGDMIAFNGVGGIYPGHTEVYEYYVFRVDQEELHFYDFKWSYKAKVPFDELVSVTTDDPLISNNTVSIQYNVDNEIYEIQIVDKGSQLTFPDDPEKENHVFVGWFLDPMFYYPYDSSNIVVNGFQLYAKFQLEDLTIKFYNGDNLYSTKNVMYGQKFNSFPVNPLIDEYDKLVYKIDFNSFDYNSSTRLFKSNGVTWSGVNSSSSSSLIVNSGNTFMNDEAFPFDAIKKIIIKSKNTVAYNDWLGYTLYISNDGVNWIKKYNQSFESGTTTRTINIKENSIQYLKIVITSGTRYKGMELFDFEIYSSPKYENNVDYVFDGWFYDEELTTPYKETDIFISDTNLYSAWKEKEYSLIFNSNGGSPVTSQFYYEDDEISLPKYNPSKIGYVFAGWYLDEEFEEEFNLELMPGDDVVLYAKWEETQAVQYLIEFYLDEELYTYIVIEEEQQLILPSAPPTAENQIFLGWYYDQEFNEQFKVTDEINDDVTLYGKFGTESSGGNGSEELPPDTPSDGIKWKNEYIAYITLGAVGLILVGIAIATPKTKKKRK